MENNETSSNNTNTSTLNKRGRSFSTTTKKHSNNDDGGSVYNDKSPFYAQLRKSYETFFPQKTVIIDRYMLVEALRKYDVKTYPVTSYDINNCPDEPPQGYPMQWNLLNDILAHWPADDPEPPATSTVYQGLCVFDYQKDYDKAIRYRNAELPFIVRGDPAVAQAVERWNTPYYMEALLGDVPQGAEYSENSEFLYWTSANSKHDTNWKPPTQHLEMTYSEWLEKANLTDDKLLMPGMPHYYFKVVGCTGATEGYTSSRPCTVLQGGEHVPYLIDELPFYTQTKSSLYIKDTVEGDETKAINCRFGMKGVMATNHFDGERNFVTVLSGERRYILASPNQCKNLSLYPFGHPSARHSKVDWSHPDLSTYPEFEYAQANEVLLQAGDSLFLPSLWFHFIVSLSLNVQCNTRSGLDHKHVPDLEDCGWS